MKHTYVYITSLGKIALEDTDGSITHIRCNPTTAKITQPTPLTNTCATELMEYFAQKRRVFDIPYVLEGTDFQKAVWQATTTIPYSHTRSATDIAAIIGQPSAVSQVGKALAACPCPILVPIHRVSCTHDTLSEALRAIENASS